MGAPRRDDLARPHKRSITLSGHRTSVTLEGLFWQCLDQAAQEDGLSLQALVTQIDATRTSENLSSALRLYVVERLLNTLEAT